MFPPLPGCLPVLAELAGSPSRFLGIEWHAWKVVGWVGNLIFFSRFFIQWYASEKQKRVVVPLAFWYLSLIGSMLLLAYAVFYKRDSVFIFAYGFTWIPYIRNIVIARRHHESSRHCSKCEAMWQDSMKFCGTCGTPLP